MPHMDGLETVKETKALYKAINEKACKANGLDPSQHQIVYRPMLIHLTQQAAEIQLFIQDQERADLFMSKPVQRGDMMALLKILQVI